MQYSRSDVWIHQFRHRSLQKPSSDGALIADELRRKVLSESVRRALAEIIGHNQSALLLTTSRPLIAHTNATTLIYHVVFSEFAREDIAG